MTTGSSWTLLPPRPGLCRECAVDHDPADPHNRYSLHYQYRFWALELKAGREPRWPTWADAIAHCTPEVRALWTVALEERGVVLDD